CAVKTGQNRRAGARRIDLIVNQNAPARPRQGTHAHAVVLFSSRPHGDIGMRAGRLVRIAPRQRWVPCTLLRGYGTRRSDSVHFKSTRSIADRYDQSIHRLIEPSSDRLVEWSSDLTG